MERKNESGKRFSDRDKCKGYVKIMLTLHMLYRIMIYLAFLRTNRILDYLGNIGVNYVASVGPLSINARGGVVV